MAPKVRNRALKTRVLRVQTAAAGDANTDDTDAIQAAVDAATATGGTVFLPKGFYRISRTINMTARALVRPCGHRGAAALLYA